jgi:hypothetical protein
MSYQAELFTRNIYILSVVSIDYNTSVESLHPSEKNAIQGDFSNTPQGVLEGVKKCTPIREFVSY